MPPPPSEHQIKGCSLRWLWQIVVERPGNWVSYCTMLLYVSCDPSDHCFISIKWFGLGSTNNLVWVPHRDLRRSREIRIPNLRNHICCVMVVGPVCRNCILVTICWIMLNLYGMLIFLWLLYYTPITENHGLGYLFYNETCVSRPMGPQKVVLYDRWSFIRGTNI